MVKNSENGLAKTTNEGSPISRVDEVQRALEQRPQWSIRARIIAVFILIFFFMSVITVSAVYLLQGIKQKQIFFEKLSSLVFEVQQTRRYEKNFFLYGTNLKDAITNVNLASELLRKNKEPISKVISQRNYQEMISVMEKYQNHLEMLIDKPVQGPNRVRIESALRKYGAQIIGEVEDTLKQEQMALHSMLQTSIVIAVTFLGFMLVMLFFFGGFIIHAVLRPLARFMQYADRVANGDLAPIKPIRKYRDEFSNLAIAFNRMLRDLLHRHEQLIQSEKMAVVGNLTSGIAHELNNPLNNIGLSVEALLDGISEMSLEQRTHILEQVATQVDRASGTVRNLLDFTRKERQVFTTLDIGQALQTSLKLVENERKLAGVDLSLEIDSNLPTVKGNPRGLEQVFLNLFLNAIQAMGEGGELGVSASSNDDCIVVKVSDTGPGIDEKHTKQIFEPFFTTKDPGKGTGLGLFVSLGIVEDHGGRLEVSSKMGEGTAFFVYLPYQKANTRKGGSG